jgi:hypothetical protein
MGNCVGKNHWDAVLPFILEEWDDFVAKFCELHPDKYTPHTTLESAFATYLHLKHSDIEHPCYVSAKFIGKILEKRNIYVSQGYYLRPHCGNTCLCVGIHLTTCPCPSNMLKEYIP